MTGIGLGLRARSNASTMAAGGPGSRRVAAGARGAIRRQRGGNHRPAASPQDEIVVDVAERPAFSELEWAASWPPPPAGGGLEPPRNDADLGSGYARNIGKPIQPGPLGNWGWSEVVPVDENVAAPSSGRSCPETEPVSVRLRLVEDACRLVVHGGSRAPSDESIRGLCRLVLLCETGSMKMRRADDDEVATTKPLRIAGRKATTYEGGVREPFGACWPGRTRSALKSDAVLSMLDVFPTVSKLTGGAPPADKPLDGVDIWPVCTGDKKNIERDVLLYFDNWDLQCARWNHWKLHVAWHNSGAG